MNSSRVPPNAGDPELLCQQLLSAIKNHRCRNVEPESAWVAVLDDLAIPVAVFNRDLRFVYVNKAVACASKIPAEQFRGKTVGELGFAPRICEQVDINLKTSFQTGEHRTSIIIYDGPTRTVTYECHMFPAYSDEEPIQSMIVAGMVLPAEDSSPLHDSSRH